MPLSEHVYCVTVTFKMIERVEQRIHIKFCVKPEHSSVETIWMIQKAFGPHAMSAAQVEPWHKHFRDGRESVESDPRSGRQQQAEHLRMLNVCGLQSTKSTLNDD